MDSSAEYEKLVRCSSKLRVAFQDQLISMSEDLHADGMISIDNKTEVLNQNQPLPHRAARLVDLVINRVKLMKEDYRNFVTLLRRNQRVYKPILVILDEESKERAYSHSPSTSLDEAGQPAVGEASKERAYSHSLSTSLDEAGQPADRLDPVKVNASTVTVQGTSVNAPPPYKASTGGTITIYPSMTDEEFFGALQVEGLPKTDCKILEDNKIKAKTFIMDLSESDFDGNDLGNFTFIGKRVLKRLLRQTTKRSTEEPSSITTSTSNTEMRQIEIASGSLKGNFFGKKEDYSYDVPEGVVHVSLSKEDKSEGAFSIGSGTGDVTLKWDKAAKKAYVHAWVNGSVGSNHVTWTVYGWVC